MAAVVVVLIAVVHAVFIGYVVIGGFVALRWPRTLVLHIGAVAWGFGSLALGWPCPLTSAERWARAAAGLPGLPPEGFIAHYLTGVLYPADAVRAVQILVALFVVGSWALCLSARRRYSVTGTSSAPHEQR